MTQELLSLEVLVEVKKAAPHVTTVPFEVARMAVSGMEKFSRSQKPSVDKEGVIFWQTRVKDFHAFCEFDESFISLGGLGRAFKSMGLESWRKMDGFHVAWSQAQLDILKLHFGLNEREQSDPVDGTGG